MPQRKVVWSRASIMPGSQLFAMKMSGKSGSQQQRQQYREPLLLDRPVAHRVLPQRVSKPARDDEREQHEDEPEPDLDLRERGIVRLEVELHGPDVVPLVERLQPVELHRHDVVRVVEEADVQHGKLVALLVAAGQVAGAVPHVRAAIVRAAVHRHRLVVDRQPLDLHAQVELFVHHLVVRVVGRQLGNDPQLLRVGGQQRGAHHERAAGQAPGAPSPAAATVPFGCSEPPLTLLITVMGGPASPIKMPSPKQAKKARKTVANSRLFIEYSRM
uniref:Uncharacterized protein n=1 Tax=Anopheles merus TaxID=30066 RepID=A0A182VKV8_ANOME